MVSLIDHCTEGCGSVGRHYLEFTYLLSIDLMCMRNEYTADALGITTRAYTVYSAFLQCKRALLRLAHLHEDSHKYYYRWAVKLDSLKFSAFLITYVTLHSDIHHSQWLDSAEPCLAIILLTS